MPVTKYKLHSLYINSVQIDPNDISSFQITLEQDPNNATLPISVCEIGIKNNSSYTFTEHNKIVITFSSTVSGTSNIVYNFYISKIDRSNEEELSISAVDYIGLLDESYFEKAYKTATPALTIIADILNDINGTVLSRISSDVNLTPVFENMTKRQALQHVLFATGYRIRTNANQGNYDLEIYPESYESAAVTVDDSVVYRGSSLVKNNEVNGVSITSHDYKLDDFGTIVVGEERFKDKNKVRNLRRTSDVENVINVSGAVCIQETNLNDVALRIYNDYQRYQDLNFDYVWCGEHIGKKLTIEAEDGMHTGFLKKIFLDVGLLSVVASGSMVLPNNNIVNPVEIETKSITETGSVSNEVTYNDLYQLVANKKLVAGATYRITDYSLKLNTKNGYSKDEVRVSPNQKQFDIIVKAINASALSEDAEVCEHDSSNPVFAYSDLSKWKIKYSIYSESKRFAWGFDSIYPHTYGDYVLYERKTTYWVFKNDNLGNKYTKPFPNIGDYMYNDVGLSDPYLEIKGKRWSKGIIYRLEDDRGNVAPYDFKNVQLLRYPFNNYPSGVPGSYFFQDNYACLENDSGILIPTSFTSDKTAHYFYTFDDGSGNDSSSNSSGNVSNNVIGDCLLSTGAYKIPHICMIGNSKDNVVQHNCKYITLLDCENVYIENGVNSGNITGSYNTIKADTMKFLLDQSCIRCKIGANCADIKIDPGTDVNIGSNCSDVNAGGTSITVGNNCSTVGPKGTNITIGNGCNHIYFNRYPNANVTIDSGNQYIGFETISHSGGVNNVHVESGAHTSSSVYYVVKGSWSYQTSLYVNGPLGEMMEITTKLSIPCTYESGHYNALGAGVYLAIIMNRASICYDEVMIIDDYSDDKTGEELYYDGQGHITLTDYAHEDDKTIQGVFRLSVL